MRSRQRNIARIALLAVVGLCVALAGCSRAPSVGGSSSNRAEKGRKEAETLAMDGVLAGATAQAKFMPDEERAKLKDEERVRLKKDTPVLVRQMPTPKLPPRSRSPIVVHERVASNLPYLTEADAETDALTQACEIVSRKLAELDPPLHYKPSVGELKSDFIREDSRTVHAPDAEKKKLLADYGITGNVVFVEYDVEISADQVRELRSQERVMSGLRMLGALFALALAGFLFLRADEWTKGYLTSWLALAAVMGAGAVAAAFIFM